MTKLKDIAQYCHVSVTQVSRALNNYDDVSEETRKKVLKAAQELGYVKNIVASNLANKSSRQIAIVIDGIDNDTNEIASNFVENLMRGGHECALQYGLELVVYVKKQSVRIEYATFCRQRGIQGMVIFGCNYDDPDFVDLIESDFPCVAIDILIEKENKGCVIVNNTYYSQMAVNHLVQCGCRQIGLIAGKTHSHVTRERESGYRLAMHYHGLEVNDDLIVCADYALSTAREKTLALLRRFENIDGFFCMSDQMAIGCMEAIKQLGKRIPDDVKVFGFDGHMIGTYVSPSLSSIRQDFIKKGYSAIRLLSQILAKEDTEHTIVVPCEVVLRESCTR